MGIQKNIYRCVVAMAASSFLLALPQAHASVPEAVSPAEPTSFDCLTSAYYSPEKTQEYFATGDYWREIYLNGNGTNGADGTEVYVGMLAAPPSIQFGSKIYIDGFGVGTVHDRGGAIRGNRIDIYMGGGDKGLARALNWGKRDKQCTVYPPGVALPESIASTEGTYQLPSETMPARVQRAIEKNLSVGSSGERVSQLQEKLKQMGFYKGEVNGEFDQETQNAVIAFQVDKEIVVAKDGYGAGHVGPATWNELFEPPVPDVQTASVSITSSVPTVPTYTLGDSGKAVSDAQTKLKELNFYTYPLITGNYGPVTKDAVGAFQMEYGLVTSAEDPNYGILGPKTQRILDKAARGEEVTPGDLIDIDFLYTLKPGMRSDEVKYLQEKLAKTGFYSYPEFTGLYGPVTEDAVFAFQVSQGLVRARTDVGAGTYGPVTARALDIFLNDRVYINKEMVSIVNPYRIDHVFMSSTEKSYGPLSSRYVFLHNLDYGSTGNDVKELQYRLNIDQTGTYDLATKEAVCQFQIAVGIVTGCTQSAAGTFGPTTRDALNIR